MISNSPSPWEVPLTTEALYSLENYQRDIQACKEPDEVAALTMRYLRRLQFFEVNALWLTQGPDWDFRLSDCHPAERSAGLQEQVRDAIQRGAFGWALRQSRFVTLPSRTSPEDPPLLLHSIGTRSQTSGMFVGQRLKSSDSDDKRPLALLSLILSCMASALENLELHAHILGQNERLRDLVEERTQELLQTNAALCEEKERLAVAFRSISEAIIALDRNGTVQMLNPAAAQLTGWAESSARGAPITEVIPAIWTADGAAAQLPWQIAVSAGAEVRWEQCRFLLAGREVPVGFVLSAITKEDGARVGAILVFRDRTAEIGREKERLKSSKLEALGILAGGIAHDFNNLLTVILGNIAHARLDLPEAEKMDGVLQEAENACLRARDLTQQLLTFAKGGVPVKRTALLQETVREATQFALHGSNVRAEFQLPANLCAVEADLGQITQVIQNIVLNAAQAMPRGGMLQVKAENATNEYGDGKVAIIIKDEGIGIAPEDLPRIFDPYFTTKQHGNGLGLATAYSIVKNHGGHIRVQSEKGAGATFVITLPASNRPILPELVADRAKPRGSSARILVMDDEECMRVLLNRVLAQSGHEVVCARDGNETLEIYRAALETGMPFDVVILDLTIPGGMGGRETIKELLNINPEVQAVVSSGYAIDPVMAEYEKYGFKAVVPKPYCPEDLREAIATVLRARASAAA